MVMIKNPTYVGKGPGIPTTPVPSYKTSPADPYYPKGSMGLAADEEAAPAVAPAGKPATKAGTYDSPAPAPTPAKED